MSDQFTFVVVYVALAVPALGGVAFWLHGKQQCRLSARLRARARLAMDQIPQAEINARFPFIAAQLRAEADQRICDAHQRDMREAEHFDSLPDLDGGQP